MQKNIDKNSKIVQAALDCEVLKPEEMAEVHEILEASGIPQVFIDGYDLLNLLNLAYTLGKRKR